MLNEIKSIVCIYIYILSVRKIFGEDGELMSLILPGIINRSRSVCHLHPIQGLVVIYMPSYFFTTNVHGISKCKKGIEIFTNSFG